MRLSWCAVYVSGISSAVLGGRQAGMSQRLSRLMLALAVPAASGLAMSGICSAVLGGFLDVYFTPGDIDTDSICHTSKLCGLYIETSM